MPTEPVGPLTTSPIITRFEGNPILTAAKCPYPATLTFNAGVCKLGDLYYMVFRNDVADPENPGRLHETNLGLATSWDGINWEVQPEPCFSLADDEIVRAYDPRLTVIGQRVYMCFAVDTRHGICGGVAVTDDFSEFEILSFSAPDNRNMVLFPELFGGMYVRLERPFPVYGRGRDSERFDIWISDSPDLRYWGNHQLLLGTEHVPFCNRKIGPAAPPVRTHAGWLTTFHAVDVDENVTWGGMTQFRQEGWKKRYTAGLMLLDLEDPYQVVGMCRTPLIVPEADYELNGFRNAVIFPGGMILEDDGEVKIYYGAADAVTCLATARVEDLIALCQQG
ncbi:MAG: 1,4-beta-mannosyl-N-acetylglucosamine phosphorylase [Phycisphaerae bacterium]|nr:1,4-beta-mannosyl-N-acetylglucosamine phosphorylase [Phycisphaerae bacterium]